MAMPISLIITTVILAILIMVTAVMVATTIHRPGAMDTAMIRRAIPTTAPEKEVAATPEFHLTGAVLSVKTHLTAWIAPTATA